LVPAPVTTTALTRASACAFARLSNSPRSTVCVGACVSVRVRVWMSVPRRHGQVHVVCVRVSGVCVSLWINSAAAVARHPTHTRTCRVQRIDRRVAERDHSHSVGIHTVQRRGARHGRVH
jgi:hypothetical protein